MTVATDARPAGAAASKRGYVLGLLTLVYAFNFVDRQIIGILAPAISADLGLSDGDIGWLTGLVFALFYTAVGLPIAWLADRANRVTIVAAALATWSFFTFVSSFATSFLFLALMRIGVAVGEAGGSPPSHSMLSDLYDKTERGRALGIYSLGIPFGYLIAYAVSAALVAGENVDWRLTLIVLGLPGILLAAVIKLTIKEPQRGVLDAAGAKAGVPFFEALGRLFRIPSYWGMCLGISFASFAGYAVATFAYTYIRRAFPDLGAVHILVVLGLVNGIAYGAGTFAGGALADRFAKRSVAAYPLVSAFGSFVAILAFTAGLWTGQWAVFVALLCAYVFFLGFYLGPSFSVAQTLAPIEVRATSTAVFFFVLNLIALGGGPTITGELSDAFAQSRGAEEGLRLALTWLIVPGLMAVAAFLVTAKTLPRDWARSQASLG